jgi:hypothetical protein
LNRTRVGTAANAAVPRQSAGFALLVVLLIVLVVATSSATFIWSMNQLQARAGLRYRSTAALALAEGGVYQTLATLEAGARVGPGSAGAEAGTLSETIQVGPLTGRFAVTTTRDPDGAVIVTSAGEVAGVTRRLRARVYLASPAMLAALYAVSFIRLEEPPAATFILPYSAATGDRPWIHLAAGHEIWFRTSHVAVNDPQIAYTVGPGPVDAPETVSTATRPSRPGAVRLLLAEDAVFTLYPTREVADVERLRTRGVYLDAVITRARAFPVLPIVDQAYYQATAAANTTNAGLNAAAGKHSGDADLAFKRDSLYTARQFEQLQVYLVAGTRSTPLRGVVYVTGGVAVTDQQDLRVHDGALITESAVYVGGQSTLTITHSAATRTLPGLVVLGRGGLIVTERARLRVHGLVYASRLISVADGAHVDIVGAVLGADAGLSFRNLASTVVIRYDAAVLGTPGLRTPPGAPVVAWVAAWEELP